MSSGAFVDYSSTEKVVRGFSKNFNITMIIAVCGSFVMPILVAGFHYLRGTYSAEVWFLPFPMK